MNLQLIRLKHYYDKTKSEIFVAIDLKNFDRNIYAVDFICLDIQWIAANFDEHQSLMPIQVARILEYCYKAIIINDLNQVNNLNVDINEMIDIDLFANWECSTYGGHYLSFEEKQQQIKKFTSISSVSEEEKKKFILSLL